MLKRVMATVLSICMIAALFTAVSAEEAAVGGGVVSSGFTDDFTTLGNAYSVTNLEKKTAVRQKRTNSDGAVWNVIAKSTNAATVEGSAEDINTLAITSSAAAAEIVYRAVENKFFTGVDVNIWRENDIITPAISYSNDGENWADIVETSGGKTYSPANFGWTQTQDGGSKDNDWIGIHNNNKKDVPYARFVKISFPSGSGTARIVDISLTVGGFVSSSLTDDFTTLDNAYSVTNFEKATAINQGGVITNKELSGSTAEPKTINTLIMSKYTEKAEIIYRAADNKQFASVDVNFWRQNNVKFPQIAYSEDGQEWKTRIQATDSAVSGNSANWSLPQSPNDTNNWIAVHNNIQKDMFGAKFVKITFPAYTVGYDNERVNARIINISLTVNGLISESLTENFETLDNAYSVTNFEQADALRYPKDNDKNGIVVPTNKPLTDKGEPTTIKTLIMKDYTKAAELVYQTTEGKEFTGIDVNFMRDGESVKFPGVSYSDDGESWTTLISATENKVDDVLGVWTKAQDGQDYGWTFRYNNNTKSIPGAKFIKITFPAETVSNDNKRVNARIIDLTLTVDDVAYANTLSVAADGTATLTDAGGKADGAKLFIAEYNSDGILINAAAYSVAPINGSFEKKLEKTANGAYFKAFLFGGESGTEPITAFATSKN